MKTMRHLFRALPLWTLLLGVASCDKEDIVAGGNGAEASGERVTGADDLHRPGAASWTAADTYRTATRGGW